MNSNIIFIYRILHAINSETYSKIYKSKFDNGFGGESHFNSGGENLCNHDNIVFT